MTDNERCEDCTYSEAIRTEYGTIDKCTVHNRLLKKKHLTKRRPKWCIIQITEGIDD